jgi:hypothetical protein
MFKLILKEAISAALSRFINRLSGKNCPPDSEAAFAATERVNGQAERLERVISGVAITIAGDAFFLGRLWKPRLGSQRRLGENRQLINLAGGQAQSVHRQDFIVKSSYARFIDRKSGQPSLRFPILPMDSSKSRPPPVIPRPASPNGKTLLL